MARSNPQKNPSLNFFIVIICAIVVFSLVWLYLGSPLDHDSISLKEVLAAQDDWAKEVVNIGKIYRQGGDYSKAASDFIDRMYSYQTGQVLFKPTLASKIQFRLDKEGALSYLVAGNPKFPEDHGFALKPWKNVRFENVGIKTKDDIAIAMGNYFFTPENGPELKVEYTFAYAKDRDGSLKIILHDSHLPYIPKEEH